VGLFTGFVEARREIDGLFLDVLEQLHRDARQATFGIAVGSCRIAVDGTEVALAVDQHVTHREVLRHAHERVVHAGVAVRVIVAQHLTDDLRALAVRAARRQVQIAHRVEDAAMHGFQSVADIGDGSPDDHAHRVIQVRGAHLVLNADRMFLRVLRRFVFQVRTEVARD
jgi:hypothetical protein